MDNQHAQEAGDSADDILDYNDLSLEEKTALAEQLSRPVVVPLHVILTFAKLAGICAAEIDENESLYNALAGEGLASMEPASDQDREESHRLPLSGAGRAPSIWNPVAFFSLDDARTAGLSKHRKLFTAIAQKGGKETAEAKAMLDLIEDAATRQLQLF